LFSVEDQLSHSKGGGDITSSTNGHEDDFDDDPWASIAAPPPSISAKPLNLSSAAAAPAASRGLGVVPRARQAQHVSLDSVLGKKSDTSSGASRGRGRAAPMKLGVQRINRTTD
jgi:hypothetical protein